MRVIIDCSDSEDGGEDSPAPPHEASSNVSLSRDQEFNSYAYSKKILRKAADSDTLGKGESSVPDETGTEPKPNRPRRRQPTGKTEKGHVILDVAIHRCQEVMDQTPTANQNVAFMTPD
ncbi:hypothetical protein CCACVL1_08831 [Corchorus capsularis]|uniref:Uncharacterized protein n=1 Tax=Corchorus capsularis TaxID=210143 RepID=A0A1R3IYL7_COCAP|nr:hypothetical protein CCACVL1_08831 [Corchorus capsularis]